MRVSKGLRRALISNMKRVGLQIGEIVHVDFPYGRFTNFMVALNGNREDILFMQDTTPVAILESEGHVVPLTQDYKMMELQNSIIHLLTIGVHK